MDRDKEIVITWMCDERVDESVWQVCASVAVDQCWLDAMAPHTPECDNVDYAIADSGDTTATSACACDRFEIIQCRADAPLITNNDHWRWGRHNTLMAEFNQQWMMDMVNFYSNGDGFTTLVTSGGEPLSQTEMCALDQAFAIVMAAGVAGAEHGAYEFRRLFDYVVDYISYNDDYSPEFGEKLRVIIYVAQNDGRLDELNWLMNTVTDLSGGYQWDWNGDATNGEGHGSAQMYELLNLMNHMRNGGDWDVLGAAIGPDGSIFDTSVGITEWNDGTGGAWEAFSYADYDAWIASLNQDIMGVDWTAENTGGYSKYQELFDEWWGYIPTAAPPSPMPTFVPTFYPTVEPSECGPNEHWVECDYCTESDCKGGTVCAKIGVELPCLIQNQCVCDAGHARYTGMNYIIRLYLIHFMI